MPLPTFENSATDLNLWVDLLNIVQSDSANVCGASSQVEFFCTFCLMQAQCNYFVIVKSANVLTIVLTGDSLMRQCNIGPKIVFTVESTCQ